jgi:hypothetical protein
VVAARNAAAGTVAHMAGVGTVDLLEARTEGILAVLPDTGGN